MEEIIKYKFNSKNLLKRCLTHKSYDENVNNEKLEFLGDRVLGLVIAKKLLEIYPNEKEGILDKKLASLVNKKTCLEVAKSIELEKYIKTLNPKNKIIKIEDKIISIASSVPFNFGANPPSSPTAVLNFFLFNIFLRQWKISTPIWKDLENDSPEIGKIINSWNAIGESECEPPLIIFIIGTGKILASSPPKYL